MIQTIVRCSVRGSCSSPATDSVPSASFGCNMYLRCGSVTSHCHSCNKTGRWPALFLTLTLHLWRSLYYFLLLFLFLHYLGHFFLHYSTLPYSWLWPYSISTPMWRLPDMCIPYTLSI